MNQKNPLLSILITTYERASELQFCLESFKTLNSKVLSQIEFVVLDNGSSDNTIENLRIASNELPLRFLRVENNIGFDNAILLLHSEAYGEYVWFFGDRYCVTEIGKNKFPDLLDWISTEQPDVVTFNSKLLTLPSQFNEIQNIETVLEVKPYLLTKIVHFDSLPSNITKQVIVKKIDPIELEEFIGSEFMQVALNLSKVSQLEHVKLGIFQDEIGFYTNSASSTSGFRFSTFGMLNGKRKIHAKYPEITNTPIVAEEVGFILHEKLGKSKMFDITSDVNNYSEFISLVKKLNIRLSLKDRVIALIFSYCPTWILKKILVDIGNISIK